MTQILTNAPIWVWPLFVLLLVVGLRARKDRHAPVALIYCLPLLGIMSVRTVWDLPAPPWIMGIFALLYLGGLWLGYVAQRRWTGAPEGRFVHLAGESWTLIAMMLIFWANFASGFLQAVAVQVYQGGPFQIVFVALLGLVSGSFAGRALQVWRLMRGFGGDGPL